MRARSTITPRGIDTGNNVINEMDIENDFNDSNDMRIQIKNSMGKNNVIAVDMMYSPEDTWKGLELQGERLCQSTSDSLFFRALTAGIFIGLGGILTVSVGFDMAGGMPWMPGAGLARFMSGAIGFPLTIVLATVTGNGAWTVDALLITLAYSNRRCSMQSVIRVLLITYFSLFLGAYLMGVFASLAALPALTPCKHFAEHKVHLTFLQLVLRGIGAGCLINLAVVLAKASRSLTGKVIGIWMCISTYVICDFEHSLVSFTVYIHIYTTSIYILLLYTYRHLYTNHISHYIYTYTYIGKYVCHGSSSHRWIIDYIH